MGLHAPQKWPIQSFNMVGSVLVAEQEPATRELLREALVQDGFRVEVAASSSEALAHASDFDVVLADIRLDLLAALKARAPLTEVVLLTGATSLADAVAAVGRGAFDFVLRPFFIEDISLTVACAAARRQRAGLGSTLTHVRKTRDLLR
jgi:two-component system response regulator AtoC